MGNIDTPNKNMNASTRSEMIRNRTLYVWNRDKPTYKKEQERDPSAEVVQNRKVGALQVACACAEEVHISLDESLFLVLDDVLRYAATANLGPTRCARFNYLWFASVAQAFRWVTPTPRIHGTHDGWSWSTRASLTESEQFVWMNRVFAQIMPSFVPGWNSFTLLELERTAMGWTAIQQVEEVKRIQTKGRWDEWVAAWNAWWSYRQADGSTAALTPPAPGVLPNGTTVLEVAGTQDPATFPQPTQWTPLKVVKKQSYLTYNWKNVASTGLTVTDETAIEAAADAYFLSRPAENVQREAEIAEVMTITATLTDSQKVQAEFWAGGPHTVSPPGMCMWFWKDYAQTFNIGHTRGFDVLILSGLDIAIHVFETSRIVWGLKRAHMEARPIQEIRRIYRGITLTGYDGQPVQGESWVPYQETTFVTPPFADFPSGHSAFSQSFANTMTAWFGPTIPTSAPKSRSDLVLLSPVFTAPQTGPFATYVFPQGGSQIQAGTVPATPVTVSWNTWQSMADAAGISRKYGGIHATSAHTGSQAAANELHTRLVSAWGIQT
jgi:hypothetical protein